MQTKFQFLEQIRIQNNLTYEQLASEIGLSSQTLHNILKGKTKPHLRNEYKIDKWLAERITPKTEVKA